MSALQIGATLVLYDGSPLKDPSYLWRLTDELKITVFGTRYILCSYVPSNCVLTYSFS